MFLRDYCAQVWVPCSEDRRAIHIHVLLPLESILFPWHWVQRRQTTMIAEPSTVATAIV